VDRCGRVDHGAAVDRCAPVAHCAAVVQSASAVHVARVALKRESARFCVLPARDAVNPHFVREVLDAPDAPRDRLVVKVCEKARISPGDRPEIVLRLPEHGMAGRKELSVAHRAIRERLAAEPSDWAAHRGHRALAFDLHHDRPEPRDRLQAEDLVELRGSLGWDARPHRWVASLSLQCRRLELEIPGDVLRVHSKHETAAILYQGEGLDSAPPLRSFFPESLGRKLNLPFASRCDAPGDRRWAHLIRCRPLSAGCFRAQV
jgi:hypothetical protein